MRGLVVALAVGLFLALAACATSQFPSIDLTPDLRGRLQVPAEGGPHAAILLLHGSGGLRDSYHEEAAFLADHGFVVLVLDYYDNVGWGGLSGAERRKRWTIWQDEVVEAVDYLRSLPEVSADRVALVGYSQGAALALSTAHRIIGLRAIVDFFGPNVEGWYAGGVFGNRELLPEDYLDRMPPVLILHGSSDPIVPPGNSQRLHDDLVNHGRIVEMHVYPGSLHAFNDPFSGSEKADAVAADARTRMLRFVDTHTRDAE